MAMEKWAMSQSPAITTNNYPDGEDYAWLAVDVAENIAVFTSAGMGPIPLSVLADREHADEAEHQIRLLPEICRCPFLVVLPSTEYFVGIARRGLFAYDWQDVHRTVGFTRQYELLAKPDVPVKLESMPPSVAAIARKARLDSVRFADSPTIDLRKLVACFPA